MITTGPTAKAAGFLGLSLCIAAPACGALRQNLKNQFVSYRGTWHCPNGKCVMAGMARSTKNHREGEVNITHAKLDPRAAMVFYPGTPVETFAAKISCGGETTDVIDKHVLAPGAHKVKGQSDSWVVLVDPAEYDFSGCKTYRVTTHSTWEGGKREYDESAGIEVE